MTNKASRQKPHFLSPINADSTVHSLCQKYFALPVGQIIFIPSRRPVPDRGALRGRHDSLARDAMDAVVSKRRTTRRRTAKSCGPDVSTLTFNRPMMLTHCGGDGGKKARSPGRARKKPLKPSRGECRNVSAYLWGLAC